MKIRNSIYILTVGAFLVSCNDLDVDDSVDFNVSLASDNTYEAGDPVVFNFDGNPDYITWWSGEEGHKYANRERTELPLEEIESVTLSFEAQARYGKVTNTLSLFVSDDFSGLSKDVTTDKVRVADFESDATLLSGNGELLESKFSNRTAASFDLMPYCISEDTHSISELTLAFHYKADFDGTNALKRWDFYSVAIKTIYKNGNTTTLNLSDLGLQTFDRNPNTNPKHAQQGDPYFDNSSGSSSCTGVWDLRSSLTRVNSFMYLGGGTNETDYTNNADDWLFTKSLKFNTCDPDENSGVLKNINVRLPSYSYVYTQPGTYTVTFIAGNQNVYGSARTIKEVTFTIKEKE